MAMKVYKDKDSMGSGYRAAIMFRTVGIIFAIVAAAGFMFPYDNGVIICSVCAALIIPAFFYQIFVDRTIIFSGEWIVNDGDYLYTVIGAFNMGFGRVHHVRKQVKVYRVSSIEQVLMVKEYSFGIAIKARVCTEKMEDVDKDMFKTPGTMRERLKKQGREKVMLFRLERNLLPKEEAKLLAKLSRMQRQNRALVSGVAGGEEVSRTSQAR